MKNYNYKKIFLFFCVTISVSFNSVANIPDGYYNTANGKSGYTLKTALYNIIKGHNTKSYGALWNLYKTSDVKSNGKVWDMYSDIPGGTPAYEYTFVSDQCGNYSGEGSCYNREHSFPKSWFNDASPMTTDPFHIVPSDGYVNGKRGNYPYGEVGSATFTSTNGSKLGASNYPGYSGTVFEPIDDYKGDFARGYFYMATRYENLIAGWEN
ncbi:Endonuclease I, partial [hydrothermal vent metagenome]